MNEFVAYLNGLHSYNAQNQNAYGERNRKNRFYKETLVEIKVCQFIKKTIENDEPLIILLTGHAGDGKTSIMYSVLEDIGAKIDYDKDRQRVMAENGQTIYCVKDFSELSDSDRKHLLKEANQHVEDGEFVFIVANTGPIINAFGKIIDGTDSKEAKNELISAMNSNDGNPRTIQGYKMRVINIALMDNIYFANEYLRKIVQPSLWQSCDTCVKRDYCHIKKNHDLINGSINRVTEFMEFFYIWQMEYGNRPTIRSMAEHIAYMITGGDSCDSISSEAIHNKLFFNLFFGYEGFSPNPDADTIPAVRLEKKSMLLATDIIKDIDTDATNNEVFDDEIKRMYLFMSITPEEGHKKDLEDVFSKQFLPYIDVRRGKKTSREQKTLLISAMKMLYTGSITRSRNRDLAITMGTDIGTAQNVLLVVGNISVKDIQLESEESSLLDNECYNLIVKIKNQKICVLTLPMLNHFEELKNGIISTNVDPQLSYGIENLKAGFLKYAYKDDCFEILCMRDADYENHTFEIHEGILYMG